MNKVLEVIDLITTDLTVKSIINSVNSNQEKSKDAVRLCVVGALRFF